MSVVYQKTVLQDDLEVGRYQNLRSFAAMIKFGRYRGTYGIILSVPVDRNGNGGQRVYHAVGFRSPEDAQRDGEMMKRLFLT